MEKFCDLFTLRPSDLITTLTDVLMENFCPCFSNYRHHLQKVFATHIMSKDNILGTFNLKFVNIVIYKEMIANIKNIYFTVLKYVVKHNTSHI